MDPEESYPADFIQLEGKTHRFLELVVETFLAEVAVTVAIDLESGVRATARDGKQFTAEFVYSGLFLHLLFELKVALRTAVE